MNLPARFAATSLTTTTTIPTEATAAAIAAVSTAVTAEPTTTATTAGSTLAWPRFIDLQHPASDFLSVELFDRRSRFVVRRHFDEGEAFRLSGGAVFNHAC